MFGTPCFRFILCMYIIWYAQGIVIWLRACIFNTVCFILDDRIDVCVRFVQEGCVFCTPGQRAMASKQNNQILNSWFHCNNVRCGIDTYCDKNIIHYKIQIIKFCFKTYYCRTVLLVTFVNSIFSNCNSAL